MPLLHPLRALGAFESIGDLAAQSIVLDNLLKFELNATDSQMSDRWTKPAERLLAQLTDADLTASLSFDLGRTKHRLARPSEAIRDYQHAAQWESLSNW